VLRVTLVFVPATFRVMANPDFEGRLGRERLEDLFRRHEPAVVAYVRCRAPEDVVDDIVAETFLVAWRRLDDVPELALPWLLGVARRVLSTHRRGDRRRRELGSRLEATQSTSPPAWSEAGEERAVAALATLAERDREALMLIAWEGLTPKQAAVVLGEPAVRFRVRLHRAKRRIKALLEQPSSTQTKPITSSVHQGAANDD
jgi:RNA polymerase sigma factor (sigma-70 family)